MNTPVIYTPDQVVRRANEIQVAITPGRYVPARGYRGPYGLQLRHRIKCAWLVFVGKADVLKWEGQ